MKELLLSLVAFFVIMSQHALAETVKVGLEPLPPLITEDGKGYTIAMLRAIEQVSELEFDIQIMIYERAKKSLKDGSVDIMGHTPYQSEVKSFYTYAQEINWSVPAVCDFYARDKAVLNNPKQHQLGTPRGNGGFFSELLGIPMEQFYEARLENLLKMLYKGRSSVEVFIFERGSTMSTIKKLQLTDVYYADAELNLRASLAVGKSNKGYRLKNILEASILKIDHDKVFRTYNYYLNMPKSGKVVW